MHMKTYQDQIISWLKANPTVFQYRQDEAIFHLQEFGSGKSFIIDAKTIVDSRLTKNSQGFSDYLNLVFENQTQIALYHDGIAFPLSFAATGDLPGAPNVMSMADYNRLFNQLKELVKVEESKPHALLLFQILIASLDGAKLIKLDVGYEEEALEKLLTEFEKGFTFEKAEQEEVQDIILDKSES